MSNNTDDMRKVLAEGLKQAAANRLFEDLHRQVSPDLFDKVGHLYEKSVSIAFESLQRLQNDEALLNAVALMIQMALTDQCINDKLGIEESQGKFLVDLSRELFALFVAAEMSRPHIEAWPVAPTVGFDDLSDGDMEFLYHGNN